MGGMVQEDEIGTMLFLFWCRGWFDAFTVGNTLKSSSTSLDISSGRRLGITMQQSLHGSGTDGGSGGDHVCLVVCYL